MFIWFIYFSRLLAVEEPQAKRPKAEAHLQPEEDFLKTHSVCRHCTLCRGMCWASLKLLSLNLILLFCLPEEFLNNRKSMRGIHCASLSHVAYPGASVHHNHVRRRRKVQHCRRPDLCGVRGLHRQGVLLMFVCSYVCLCMCACVCSHWETNWKKNIDEFSLSFDICRWLISRICCKSSPRCPATSRSCRWEGFWCASKFI